MIKLRLQGPWPYRIRSLLILYWTIAGVMWRAMTARRLVPQWPLSFEIGTVFYRRQFNYAFTLPDIQQGRLYFDSLQTYTVDALVKVQVQEVDAPLGHWFIPEGARSDAKMLYFHGGGYAFYPAVTHHFIALLAQTLQVRIFAPNYRLTPEFAHPAQQEDALAAYRYMLSQCKQQALLLGGDSAGGHLVLMTLSQLALYRLPQPCLAMCLSPWTDISYRGASQFGFDKYDMVQGYQTLLYGQWLKGAGRWDDKELSPIHQALPDVAPIYIQAGGKEILLDMIRDYAAVAVQQQTQIRLDIWEHMTHEFHGYGDYLPQSRHALAVLRQVMEQGLSGQALGDLPTCPQTVVNTFSR